MKKAILLLALIMLLAACQPKPTSEIVEVTVPVEITVLVTQPPKLVGATVLVTQPPPPTYTPCPTYTPYPTYTLPPQRTITPQPTATPRPTATPKPLATPTPTARSIGTKLNPVPFGRPIQFAKLDSCILEMHLTQTVGGDAATEIVNRGKEFLRSVPPEGHEFYLGYFDVDFLEGPADQGIGISFTDFGIVVNKQRWSTGIVVMDDELRVSFYVGGHDEGWMPFIIPKGGEVEAIFFEPSLFADDIWFAVE